MKKTLMVFPLCLLFALTNVHATNANSRMDKPLPIVDGIDLNQSTRSDVRKILEKQATVLDNNLFSDDFDNIYVIYTKKGKIVRFIASLNQMFSTYPYAESVMKTIQTYGKPTSKEKIGTDKNSHQPIYNQEWILKDGSIVKLKHGTGMGMFSVYLIVDTPNVDQYLEDLKHSEDKTHILPKKEVVTADFFQQCGNSTMKLWNVYLACATKDKLRKVLSYSKMKPLFMKPGYVSDEYNPSAVFKYSNKLTINYLNNRNFVSATYSKLTNVTDLLTILKNKYGKAITKENFNEGTYKWMGKDGIVIELTKGFMESNLKYYNLKNQPIYKKERRDIKQKQLKKSQETVNNNI